MPYKLDIHGWMLEVELQTIEKWAKELPPGSVIVEVGSFYGRSTCCWAASAPDCSVFCFDQWFGEVEELGSISIEERKLNGFPLPGETNTYEQFLNNTKHLENVSSQKVYYPEQIVWDDNVSPDIVFIDAAHSNPIDRLYIDFWLPKIKKGGYICGHDYNLAAFADVTDNVRYIEQTTGSKVETFEHGSLWRIKV